MDIFTAKKRSEIMRNIPSKNTAPELKLRKALYALGLRYRLHPKKVLGKPDVVFPKQKVAVFVDGDWWHGRNYDRDSQKYTDFWKDKIANNMERDIKVSSELSKDGWKVVRLWQKDIEKDVVEQAKLVMTALGKTL